MTAVRHCKEWKSKVSVCTDRVNFEEQRVQRHSVESEREEAPEHLEQGQEQDHHQVRHIYRINNCIYRIIIPVFKCIIVEVDTLHAKLDIYVFLQVSHWGKDQNQWDESELVGLFIQCFLCGKAVFNKKWMQVYEFLLQNIYYRFLMD